MKGPMALDQEFIDKVKAQMHRIVDENLPIVKRSVSTSEAVALFISIICMTKRSCLITAEALR